MLRLGEPIEAIAVVSIQMIGRGCSLSYWFQMYFMSTFREYFMITNYFLVILIDLE